MSDPALARYRVTYGKTGRLALLSHLEVAHALERAIRRADLPFAVTQGFSPHMKIGYGSALPVGVGSTCELLDLYLSYYMPPQKVLERLQAASPADMMPTAVRSVSPAEAAANVAFPYSTYEAVVEAPGAVPERLTVPDIITVDKQGKTKELHVADFLAGEPQITIGEDGLLHLTYTLQIKQTGSLRPDLLCRELCRENGLDGQVVGITRIKQSRVSW